MWENTALCLIVNPLVQSSILTVLLDPTTVTAAGASLPPAPPSLPWPVGSLPGPASSSLIGSPSGTVPQYGADCCEIEGFLDFVEGGELSSLEHAA